MACIQPIDHRLVFVQKDSKVLEKRVPQDRIAERVCWRLGELCSDFGALSAD